MEKPDTGIFLYVKKNQIQLLLEAIGKLHGSEKSAISKQVEEEKLCFSGPADGGLAEEGRRGGGTSTCFKRGFFHAEEFCNYLFIVKSEVFLYKELALDPIYCSLSFFFSLCF